MLYSVMNSPPTLSARPGKLRAPVGGVVVLIRTPGIHENSPGSATDRSPTLAADFGTGSSSR